MNSRRKFLAAAVTGLAAAAVSSRLLAQGARPLQIVVGFPPGGGSDILARLVAEKLRPFYPEGVVVENRVGATGRIALEYVKAAPPDGRTLLFTPDFLFTIFPNVYKKLTYDAVADFAPVATCARVGLVLAVGPMVPANVKTVADFVQWTKANPRQAAFASSGAGGIFHLLGVMFNRTTGTEMTHVPYKGGAPALQDLMGGQIAASFNGVNEALPLYKAGKLRVLTTFSPKRSPYLPDVPTMVELGHKDFVVESWTGVFAPAKTPANVVSRVNSEIGEALKNAEFISTVEKFAMGTFASTPAGLAAQVKAGIERWSPVVKASGFTAED